MACQHRKCYGFEVMSSRESTVLIFNLLLRKFKTMPEEYSHADLPIPHADLPIPHAN